MAASSQAMLLAPSVGGETTKRHGTDARSRSAACDGGKWVIPDCWKGVLVLIYESRFAIPSGRFFCDERNAAQGLAARPTPG
jgi:hypothetical protein